MTRAPAKMPQVGKATAVYLALIAAFSRRKRELDWSFWNLDDAAGLQDGYGAKMFNPNSPNGRQSTWPMFDLAYQALFPQGATVLLIPNDAVKDDRVTADSLILKLIEAGVPPDVATAAAGQLEYADGRVVGVRPRERTHWRHVGRAEARAAA
jgi:hypothetical protein